MKKLTQIFLLLLIFLPGLSMSQPTPVPTYTLTVKNIKFPLPGFPNQLTFDIYLLHTNPSVMDFKYNMSQYSLNINSLIANGGSLMLSIIASDLPPSMRPPSFAILGNILVFSSNLPISNDSFVVISHTSPGTLILRFKISTSAPQFTPGQDLNLSWRDYPLLSYVTRIYAIVDSSHLDITTPETHSVDSILTNINLQNQLASEFSLSQNYPNPFNPTTTINYQLPEPDFVSIKVYNSLGTEVATLVNERKAAGIYSIDWDASEYSSGVYLYKIKAGDFEDTKLMLLIK